MLPINIINCIIKCTKECIVVTIYVWSISCSQENIFLIMFLSKCCIVFKRACQNWFQHWTKQVLLHLAAILVPALLVPLLEHCESRLVENVRSDSQILVCNLQVMNLKWIKIKRISSQIKATLNLGHFHSIQYKK